MKKLKYEIFDQPWEIVNFCEYGVEIVSICTRVRHDCLEYILFYYEYK